MCSSQEKSANIAFKRSLNAPRGHVRFGLSRVRKRKLSLRPARKLEHLSNAVRSLQVFAMHNRDAGMKNCEIRAVSSFDVKPR